jgi:CubicO group peptidase (beta-lactamase class C family)
MLLYLQANLHPEKLPPNDSANAATLPDALRRSHLLEGEMLQGMQISLGWLYEPQSGSYWQNGATGGYSSYAFFNPKEDFGAVVLLNLSPEMHGAFAERLGKHIRERLAGKPATSLTP